MSGRQSICQKLKDGRWQARVWDHRKINRDGTRGGYTSKRFVKRGEALAWIKATEGKVANGVRTEHAHKRTTVGDELERWATSGRVGPRTLEIRAEALRTRFPLWLTDIVAAELEVDDVERWIAELERKGYKPNTVHQSKGYLGQALNRSLRARRIPFNPVSVAEPAPKPRHEPTPATSFATITSIRSAMYAPHRVSVDIEYGAGLRPAEMLALNIADVNETFSTVRVWRQWNNANEYAPLKGARVMGDKARTVPVTESFLRAIREHVRLYGTGTDGVILHTREGTPLSHDGLQSSWRNARKGAGVEGVTPHKLRHAFGSVHYNAGVPVTVVAGWMGHTPETFIRTYAHHEEGVRPTLDVLAGETCTNRAQAEVIPLRHSV